MDLHISLCTCRRITGQHVYLSLTACVCVCVSHQCTSSIHHGLVGEEVLLGGVVAAVRQLIVLHQEAQIRHLSDLKLRRLWGIAATSQGSGVKKW